MANGDAWNVVTTLVIGYWIAPSIICPKDDTKLPSPEDIDSIDVIPPSNNVQKKANSVTVQTQAAFKAALSFTADEAFSIRKINIAEAIAAAILHTSPTLNGGCEESPQESSAVPANATSAEIHVGIEIWRANKIYAKNGTNLTLR